ncbi:Hypothetical_protein [Hexamita inflata]|uniref:Hypothetical_protein n=1 Tax=Hexamita inflata TaxID=28002 RepID=A0AA86QQY2_9EUKA|nr:Hypothetical protein HINF_LOCUS33467 [Hexamita inflata]CAI9956360.1 Hypothetical protein HINF_LOCUS44005 [Hexamita inflata]
MTYRKKISHEQEQRLENNFIQKVNTKYNVNTTSFQEAIQYYKQLPRKSKQVFNWKALDDSIGHDGYPTKAFSYKYILEVLAGRCLEQLSSELKQLAREHACDLFRSRFSLTNKTDRQYYLELRYAVTKETVAFVENQVKTNFCKKSLTDMLRYTLDEQLQAQQNVEQLKQIQTKYIKADQQKEIELKIRQEKEIQKEVATYFVQQIEELMFDDLKAINHIQTTK